MKGPSLSNKTGKGSGIDAGIQIRVGEKNWIGVSLLNAIQPEIAWDTESQLTEKLKQETKLGLGMELLPELMVAVDIYNDQTEDKQKINVGAEYSLIKGRNMGLYIRGGTKNSRYTGGVRIEVKGKENK